MIQLHNHALYGVYVYSVPLLMSPDNTFIQGKATWQQWYWLSVFPSVKCIKCCGFFSPLLDKIDKVLPLDCEHLLKLCNNALILWAWLLKKNLCCYWDQNQLISQSSCLLLSPYTENGIAEQTNSCPPLEYVTENQFLVFFLFSKRDSDAHHHSFNVPFRCAYMVPIFTALSLFPVHNSLKDR